jgi:tetratricopeptide (TPR) repeat protein
VFCTKKIAITFSLIIAGISTSTISCAQQDKAVKDSLREIEASKKFKNIEGWYEKGDYEKAIEGDGKNIGFREIANQYDSTKAANLSRLYVGIYHFKKKEYQQAIHYLKDVQAKDNVISSMANGAIGEAYLTMNDTPNAVECYVDAAENSPNQFTSSSYLLKAGKLYEDLEDYTRAAFIYGKLRDKYPNSVEAEEADKAIMKLFHKVFDE